MQTHAASNRLTQMRHALAMLSCFHAQEAAASSHQRRLELFYVVLQVEVLARKYVDTLQVTLFAYSSCAHCKKG